MYSDLYIVNLA